MLAQEEGLGQDSGGLIDRRVLVEDEGLEVDFLYKNSALESSGIPYTPLLHRYMLQKVGIPYTPVCKPLLYRRAFLTCVIQPDGNHA